MTRPIRVVALTLAILGPATALIVLAVTRGRSGAAGPTPSPAEATETEHDDEDGLRLEVASLRGQMAYLQGQAGATSARSVPPPAAAQPRPPTPEQSAAAESRFYGKLDARVLREKKDALWSDKTEAQIDHLISTVRTPGTQLKSVTCRTSLCEVVAINEDLNAQSQLSRLIGSEEPFVSSGGTYYRYGEGATLVTTVYMLRPGAEPETPELVQNTNETK
jgi:hypothetical protein